MLRQSSAKLILSGALDHGRTDASRNAVLRRVSTIRSRDEEQSRANISRYPLSQNVFTSLHVFRLIDPNNPYPYMLGRVTPMHKVIRAYCLAVVKSCQLLLECIQAQTFYEEEDFVTYLFGRELCPRMGSTEVLQLLCDAVSSLEHHDSSKLELERDMASALIQRLEARHSLLRGLERDECRASSAQLEPTERPTESSHNEP